jgi:hypothetical protein
LGGSKINVSKSITYKRIKGIIFDAFFLLRAKYVPNSKIIFLSGFSSLIKHRFELARCLCLPSEA